MKHDVCMLCGGNELRLMVAIDERPEGETDFGIAASEYHREVVKCGACGLYMNRHAFPMTHLYNKNYNEATYSSNLKSTFDFIMALPERKSDNRQRVARVADFLRRSGLEPTETRLLDVGSGLCVFLAAMKRRGFYCECIDPDPLAVAHAQACAGVDRATACDFADFDSSDAFHMLSFNKVLEHVEDPVAMLAHAKSSLTDDGHVYLELPDGELAEEGGGIVDREEFYVEHYTVFTPTSLRALARQAGFDVVEAGRVHEPSDKYTLYGFLSAL